MFGKKHGETFVSADPAGVAVPAVRQVRRKQSVKVIVGELALQRFEANFLQNHVAVWVGKDFLVDAVESAVAGIGQFIDWDAGFKGPIFEFAVALLLRKEISAIGDNKSHVAGAGLVDAGKINFVEDAVAQGEPDFAVLVKGGADAHLGARSPTRRNAGPPRSKRCGRITHRVFVLWP